MAAHVTPFAEGIRGHVTERRTAFTFSAPTRCDFFQETTQPPVCGYLSGLRPRRLRPGHVDRNRECSGKRALTTHIRGKPRIEFDFLFRRQSARIDTSSPESCRIVNPGTAFAIGHLTQ